jgi:hypothetical protein
MRLYIIVEICIDDTLSFILDIKTIGRFIRFYGLFASFFSAKQK